MKRLLFLTLILGVTISTNGQVIDGRIQKEIENLKKANVDSFLVYSLYCNGGLIPLDTCAYEETEYLLWVQHKSYFIKKFDYCRNYKAILLDTINPLSFYLTYKNLIDKEEIKIPTYVQSKKGNIETTIISTVDHTCFYKMVFHLGKRNTIKTVSDYNLTFETFDNGKKNMYYSYNQKTKLKALITQISKLVEQLNAKNKYEVE